MTKSTGVGRGNNPASWNNTKRGACADAEPVAWRVECRWTDRSKGGDWRKYADYGIEQAAAASQQVFAKPGDIESRIVPLFTHPAPTLSAH